MPSDAFSRHFSKDIKSFGEQMWIEICAFLFASCKISIWVVVWLSVLGVATVPQCVRLTGTCLQPGPAAHG